MKNAPKETDGAAPAADPNFKPEFETIKLKKTEKDWLITEPINDTSDFSQLSSKYGIRSKTN